MEYPLLCGRNSVSLPGPNQHFWLKEYCFKTVSTWPITIRGLVKLGSSFIDIFLIFLSQNYRLSIQIILTHFLIVFHKIYKSIIQQLNLLMHWQQIATKCIGKHYVHNWSIFMNIFLFREVVTFRIALNWYISSHACFTMNKMSVILLEIVLKNPWVGTKNLRMLYHLMDRKQQFFRRRIIVPHQVVNCFLSFFRRFSPIW